MEVIVANALFVADDEGVMVITDIKNKPDVVFGELIYDGGNVAILNRNNESLFALPNISPDLRKTIVNASEVVIIEHRDDEDVYAYSVEVKPVESMNFPDDWDKFANEVANDLKNTLSPEDFTTLVDEFKDI